MKRLILCILLVITCLFLKVQGECVIDGKNYPVGVHHIKCITYTCHENGRITALACPQYACPPGTEVGYTPLDETKPYPECCGGPICDLNKEAS